MNDDQVLLNSGGNSSSRSRSAAVLDIKAREFCPSSSTKSSSTLTTVSSDSMTTAPAIAPAKKNTKKNTEKNDTAGHIKTTATAASPAFMKENRYAPTTTTTTEKQKRQQQKKKNGGGKREKFCQKLYLSANCKFLVIDRSEEVRKCAIDADAIVSVEDVVRIEIQNDGGSVGDGRRIRCPICLSDPIVQPVVNSCGHVLCIACSMEMISKYREMEKACKCPVCLVAPLIEADLRSCVLTSSSSFSRNNTVAVIKDELKVVGDRNDNKVKFELIERNRDTLVTRRCLDRRHRSTSENNDDIGVDCWPKAKKSNAFMCDRYAKYTTISIDDMKTMCEEEIRNLESEALKAAIELDRDQTLNCFLAIESIKKRYNRFRENSNNGDFLQMNSAIEKTRVAMENAERSRKIDQSWPQMSQQQRQTIKPLIISKSTWASNSSSFSEKNIPPMVIRAEEQEVRNNLVVVEETNCDSSDDDDEYIERGKTENITRSNDNNKKYYFYQSVSNEKAILHWICFKAILQQHENDYTKIPKKINVSLLEIEKMIVDDELRDRNPHLRHFSKTTEIFICEGLLNEIVDAEILKKSEQINKRAEQRKIDQSKKKLEEKKTEAKERKREKEILAKEINFAQEILHNMPRLGIDDGGDSGGANYVESSTQPSQNNFANVARFGFGARFHDLPDLNSADLSPSSALPSLGAARNFSSSSPTTTRTTGWAQPLTNTHIDVEAALKNNLESGSKKKKSKGIPLFSSSIGRKHI